MNQFDDADVKRELAKPGNREFALGIKILYAIEKSIKKRESMV